MKCPICNKRPKVYPSVQIKGVVKEWCARCEGTRHIVSVWSSTREGLNIAWAPHNKAFHADQGRPSNYKTAAEIPLIEAHNKARAQKQPGR